MDNLDSVKDILYERFRVAADEAIKDSFVQLNKIASGTTLDQTRARIENNGGSITLVVAGPASLDYIDQGRRAGTPPPIRSISSWLQSRGLQYSVFATAAGIGARGIEPVPIKELIIDKVNDATERVFQSASSIDNDIFSYIRLKLERSEG